MSHDLYYEQKTGLLYTFIEGEKFIIAKGYAGRGRYINDPESQHKVGLGPIPRGNYGIRGPIKHPKLGPISFPLIPSEFNDMGGRSGFLIHGDNSLMNQSASRGCIIINRVGRLKIASLKPDTLHVLP